MADDRSDAGFLGRWSRLKQENRRQAPESAEDEPGAAAEPGPDAEEGDAEATAPTKLPDIDSLKKDSDYTAFMAADVPEELQRAALRRLWRSDPVLANLDGLNDYDEDFSAVGIVAQTVSSLYKAGKGYALEEEEDAVAEDGEEAAESETADKADDGESPDLQTAKRSARKSKGPSEG